MIHKLTRFQIISFNVNQQVFNFCLPTAICSSCQFGMHPSPASNTGRSPEPPNARRLWIDDYSRKCPVHTCASRNGVLSWRNEVFASPIRLNYQTWTAAHQPRENTEIYWCFVCWLFSYIFLSMSCTQDLQESSTCYSGSHKQHLAVLRHEESSCQWSLCPMFNHDGENQQQKQPLSCPMCTMRLCHSTYNFPSDN